MNRKFTKDEAQRIFSLAAERQQAKASEDSNELSIADLIEAGVAAGIDPTFIRDAASDMLRPERVTEQRKFLGYPVEIRESHVLPIEFNELNWKKSVDIFTHVYKQAGKAVEVGTTHRWQSAERDDQMPAHIIAEKEEHGTRFTVERKMWPVTLGVGLGAVINLFIGIVFFTIWMTVDTAGEMIIPASIMLGIGMLMGIFGTIGLKMFNKQQLNRFKEVFKHLDDLSEAENHTMDKNTESDVTENEIATLASDPSTQSPLLSLDEQADSPKRTRRSNARNRRKN